MTFDTNSEAAFEVVINEEGQHSIWPARKPLPIGWAQIGRQGTKEDCMRHIKDIWTDLRPLSLQKQMKSSVQ